MKNKTLFLIALTFIPFFGFTQAAEEETVQTKPFLSSIAIQSGGMIMDASFEAQIENFRKLAPDSRILGEDLTGYSKDPDYYDQASGAFSIYVDLPLQWEKMEFLNPKLRIGLQFMRYGALNYKLSRSDQFRKDTLTNGNGEEFYVDSISNQHVEMEYFQNQLLIDIGLMFSSNESSRWAVKGGFSLAGGFAYSAGTKIYYDRFSEQNVQLPGVVYEEESFSDEESFRNDGGFVGMASIPMILDFRIARKSKFFSKAHLYTEARPFLYYASISEIDNQTQSGVSFGFGFRYEID